MKVKQTRMRKTSSGYLHRGNLTEQNTDEKLVDINKQTGF